MKKLIFVFLVLITLVVIAGCQARRDKETLHFDPKIETADQSVTTITPLDKEEKGPLTIGTIKANNSVEIGGPDLAITSFEGETVETSKGYHVIRGTTPRNTAKVMVNDYTLHKYYPGQTLWSYIASAAIGTLSEGENSYTVRAFDKEGNEIDSTTLTLVYTPPVIPSLPSTGVRIRLLALMALMTSFSYFGFRRIFIK